MATIKDIAKLAGVSQGTVSNVLNGRGNVASDKILRVQNAAKELGYTANQGAQLMRKRNSKLLAVVLPNITDRQYSDFYNSFRYHAESMGYKASLFLHDGSAQREMALASEIRSESAAGVAVNSICLAENNPYLQVGFLPSEVVLVEQRPYMEFDYVGFDYKSIGTAMGTLASKYEQVVLVSNGNDNYVSKNISEAFFRVTKNAPHCRVQVYQKEHSVRSASVSLDMFAQEPHPQAAFCSSLQFANSLRHIHDSFYDQEDLKIYTLSPLFALPENDFQKYELNYRLLGKRAAVQLIGRIQGTIYGKPQEIILENDGFRSWAPPVLESSKPLTIMTLDSPTAAILKNMARLFTKLTGVDVRVAVFPYDGVHEILSNLDESTSFDILRLDVTWMNHFAPRIFEALENLDPHVGELSRKFLPNLMTRYGNVHNSTYALPETPSTQMLFYRKDLFEDTQLQRLYKERHKELLTPPTSFAQFNRIAAFFTRHINPQSPVTFGTTLTLGNTGVSATEFLTRYFALNHTLFDEKNRLLLHSPEGVQALTELLHCRQFAPQLYQQWWRDTANTFAKGDIAMTILYSNFASELTGQHSNIRDNIGFAMIPGENPLYGGGSIGICKYSKQKKLAYEFIKWLCGEEVSTAMMFLGSVSPCLSAYNNYQIIDHYPWLSMAQKCFEKTNVHRLPKTNATFDERRFLSILGIQVINAVSGACTVEEALENACRSYHKIFEN